LLSVIILAYFWPSVSADKIPYSGAYIGSDMTEFSLPIRAMAYKGINTGSMPWWSDSLALGFPLIAESQIHFFYPLQFFFFKFLPFISAFNWLLIIHFVLGAWGMYFFCRLIKLSRPTSFLSAVTFILSGFFVTHLQLISVIETATLLPWYFLICELYFQKNKFYVLAFLSLVIGIGGQFQIMYYCLLVVSLFFVWRLFFLPVTFFIKIKKIIIFILIVLFGFCLLAIQLLPTIELAQNSWRQSGHVEEIFDFFLYHPKNVLTFLFPYFFGNQSQGTYFENHALVGMPWQNNGYFGFFPVLLIFLGIFYYWRRWYRAEFKRYYLFFFILLFVLLIILLFNRVFIIRYFLTVLPGLSLFRYQTRIILLIVFCGSILAGWSFENLKVYLSKKIKLRYIYLSLVCFFIFFVIVDLFIYGYRYNTFLDSTKVSAETESSQFLKKDTSLFRVQTYGSGYGYLSMLHQYQGWHKNHDWIFLNRELLEPDINSLYGLDTVSINSGLQIRRNYRLNIILESLGYGYLPATMDYPKGNIVNLSDNYLKIQGMLNVKYLLSFFNLRNENLELVKEIDARGLTLPVKIYKNNFWQARAYLVPQVRFSATDGSFFGDLKMLRNFYHSGFNFNNQALVEEELVLADSLQKSPGRVNIKEWNNGRIRLELSQDAENFLVIANSFYPGWQAFIDDKPVKIYRANYVFQGLLVPAGEHNIVLIYKSTYYELGKKITFASYFLLVFYFFFRTLKYVWQTIH